MSEFRFIPKNKIKNLPKNPGVYCFKKGREILYIGKATNIRERVKNHFQQPSFRSGLVLNQVKHIAFIKTDSEIEALILEANLIKKYQPKYNVIWKDDKNYFFVAKTKEDFPRIFLTHQPKLEIRNWKLEINYVGPFVDGGALKQTLKVLRKVFPYRTCKTLPNRPCLWYQLDRCPAPCLLNSLLGKQPYRLRKSISLRKECQGNARNLMKILQGKKNQAIINLRKEMKKASKLQDFEKAAKIRDQVPALEKVLAHAKIFESVDVKHQRLQIQKILQKILKTKREISRIEAYDISNIQGEAAAGSMVIFIDGTPNKNFYRRFKIKIAGKPNDIAMLKECLTRRLGHPEWPYPDLILIDGGHGQLNAAQSVVKYETQNTKYLPVRQAGKIQTMALAKKENKLYIEGQKEPLLLKELPREIFNLILQLRDEAHRFAISYHRKLRKRGLLEN